MDCPEVNDPKLIFAPEAIHGKATVKIVHYPKNNYQAATMFSKGLLQAAKSKKSQFCTVIEEDKDIKRKRPRRFTLNKWDFELVFESDIFKIVGQRRDRLLILNGDNININQAGYLIERTKKEAIICCSVLSKWILRYN